MNRNTFDDISAMMPRAATLQEAGEWLISQPEMPGILAARAEKTKLIHLDGSGRWIGTKAATIQTRQDAFDALLGDIGHGISLDEAARRTGIKPRAIRYRIEGRPGRTRSSESRFMVRDNMVLHKTAGFDL